MNMERQNDIRDAVINISVNAPVFIYAKQKSKLQTSLKSTKSLMILITLNAQIILHQKKKDVNGENEIVWPTEQTKQKAPKVISIFIVYILFLIYLNFGYPQYLYLW